MKTDKLTSRLRRAKKTRAKLRVLKMPRLCMHRSLKHIYAQIISADGSQIVASASTLEKDLRANSACNKQGAEKIGALIAERALAKGVKKVGFDRSGFLYHGKVEALANAARSAGLEF